MLLKLLRALPLKNYILFESVPDFGDNTMPVFEEMVRRGLNRKYKLIWWVSDRKKPFVRHKNVRVVDTNTRLNRLFFLWYAYRSKCLIYCNRFIAKRNPRQFGVYLTHGTAVKAVGDYHLGKVDHDYTILAGKGTEGFMSEVVQSRPDQLVSLGFPRNDLLTTVHYDLHTCFRGDFHKVIVWYPTFRQHKNGNKTAVSAPLPLLHDAEQAIALNETAKQAGVLLLIKPHFAQDVEYIRQFDLSHVRFINDDFLSEHGMSSYGFVGSCDALITDYSSIYFDYLLCDKPVAAVWEDIDDYRKNPGFSIDVDYYLKGAEKVYTLSDLQAFVQRVAQGVDQLATERREINALANYADDGRNTERVVDFIIEKAGL